MPKNWNEMSYSEKCDELRRDVLRVYDALNDILPKVDAVERATNANTSKLNKVARVVEKLESGKTAKAAKKK